MKKSAQVRPKNCLGQSFALQIQFTTDSFFQNSRFLEIIPHQILIQTVISHMFAYSSRWRRNRDKVYYTCCKVYFVSSLIFNSLLRNYVLSLPYKNHFLRKSRITRHSSQNRFFNYFAKTSLLLTKLRKNILGFKRFILKSKL